MKIREQVQINGIVQGVGFRPFIFNTANSFKLSGFVSNSSEGVMIEIEGEKSKIDAFHNYVCKNVPVLARINSYQRSEVNTCDDFGFTIKQSSHTLYATTLISPDIAACDDCIKELFDENDRRYRYPFINCTNCGPRYTIVESIPYDRQFTSMKHFPFCSECEKEYKDPTNRRFHAQPNACPVCGPRLYCHNGTQLIDSDDPLRTIISEIGKGKIAAIKGIGGFHLAVDPFNIDAVKKLRGKKGRAEKPFALMARDIDTIKKYCHVSENEIILLEDIKRPIVLLKKLSTCMLPENIAPKNNYLGLMLPYSPLHHLLLNDSFDLLVMTSANLSEEPIAVSNDEAIERLSSIADLFLLHDREILQRCDDSIVRTTKNNLQIIRRSRGYVPYPVSISKKLIPGILAVGGEQKNTIAFSRSNDIFLSQYIGDLDNPKAFTFFEHSIEHLSQILEIEPKYIVCDMHPEYLSTKWAEQQSLPLIKVQHHHAHMASVMAENDYFDKVIGIILDGTGYGTDGTIWGGEVLIGDVSSFDRFAFLKPHPMPGSSKAVREPYRMALSYLYSMYHASIPERLSMIKSLDKEDTEIMFDIIDKKINSPLTSSCGRLFDAVSAILNIRLTNNYDAQAAIELEMLAEKGKPVSARKVEQKCKMIDVFELLNTVIEMSLNKYDVSDIALYFHHQLAEYFIAAAVSAREQTKVDVVALSGGVFQNKLFYEYMYDRLVEEGFNVISNKEVPINDGGLSLGQTVIANSMIKQRGLYVSGTAR